MNSVRIKLSLNSLQLNHQQFYYFDEKGNLKTTLDDWPNLEPLFSSEELHLKALRFLPIMQYLVKETKVLQISRNTLNKKTRSIVKNAAKFDEVLTYLHSKKYINYQYGGVHGRKQFNTLNPKIFL